MSETISQTPEISQELQSKIQAIRAIATCYNLLDKGSFNHNALVAVEQSLNFLKSLHQQVLEEALAHPDSDKVEELQQFKQSKEVQNVQE